MQLPTITVLMPAYNCDNYVGEAIASILAQTFTDFELMVIDDGSTDMTRQKVESFHDPRLYLIENKRNLGLIKTLNRSLELAKGRYIARMDADDIAMPDRLKQQVEYLERNSDVDVLGTMVNLVDEDGKVFGSLADYPTEPTDIRRFLLQECCLVHPSVMFRKDTILAAGGYSEDARHVEDYDLWLRLSHDRKLANLPEKLLSYRMHKNQVSIGNVVSQYLAAQRCRMTAVEKRLLLGEDAAEARRVIQPSRWQRLRGAACSLGLDYLNWARIYRWQDQPDKALSLATKAVFHSPFSLGTWSELVSSTFDALIPKAWRTAATWYGHRITKALSTKGGSS